MIKHYVAFFSVLMCCLWRLLRHLSCSSKRMHNHRPFKRSLLLINNHPRLPKTVRLFRVLGNIWQAICWGWVTRQCGRWGPFLHILIWWAVLCSWYVFVAIWVDFVFLKEVWKIYLLKSFLCWVYIELCSFISAYEGMNLFEYEACW